jgi:predicted phage-related endonuclease
MSKPTVRIDIEHGSRLAGLLATYAELKPQVDELSNRLKTVTDAIKTEATAQAPGAQAIDLEHEALATPLRLTYVEQWRVDSKRLRAENPLLYVQYATKVGMWQLRGARS